MSNLKQYFPILWQKEDLLFIIKNNLYLLSIFDNWTSKQQEEFINFCTGVRGIKLLYDGFFKEILNPESTPERLNEFLSLLMNQKVRILNVLPNDSTRIADESSLLVTDIVIQLEDNSLANVEIQKIGYSFTGQRSACYSSDLLLRQYKRVRSEKNKNNKKFSYRDIKDVYTIILYEQSPSEFHKFPDIYLHYFEQKSDTGLDLPLLQKFLFIPLDIFLKNQHNKDIGNKLDAWLLFFASDDPNDIIRLIKEYPEFQAMYEQAYQICRNVEDIMGLFSEELKILDRNTVLYMIDEMQNALDEHKATILDQLNAIDEHKATINSQQTTINKHKATINDQQTTINKHKATINDQQTTINKHKATIDDQQATINKLLKQIEALTQNS